MGLCYNVGAPRTTFFGKRENWDLQQALEQIEDGDEIEFEQGFCPTEDCLKINKSITISGNMKLLEDDTRLYTNILQKIIVRNGATVSLKDIALRTNKEKQNSLNVKEKSTVICHNVYFENNAEIGENYPILYIDEESDVSLSNCNVKPSKMLDGNHRVYCENSKLKVLNSTIEAKLKLNHTDLTCEDSTVEYHEANAMSLLNNSSANITNTTFDGGNGNESENYPIIYIDGESDASLSNCNVKLSKILGGNHKVYCENSKLKVLNSTIEAKLELNHTDLTCEDSTVEYHEANAMSLLNNSSANITNTTFDGGNGNESENYPIIYIDGESDASLSNCNVKLSKILGGNHKVYCENSKLKVLNSTIEAKLELNHTDLTCEDSTVEYHEANAMFLYNNSLANITNTIFNGGKNFEESVCPSVKVQDSEIVCNKCRVVQPSAYPVLSLENSTGKLESGWYDSIKVYNSKLNVAYIEVEESISCESNSQVNGQEMIIGGRENGKINFYADQKSVVKLERLYFGRLTTPNIKLERNVEFNVPTIKQLQYNNETNEFIFDENNQYIVTQILEDIDYFGKVPAYERLNQLIGIQSVKDEVDEYIAVAQMNKMRQAKGLKSSSSTLHALYLGNPGTGKTTVARIVGELLYEKGIISSNNFIEVSRSDLVGAYIGHTAKQTREVLEKALGGVLFIDEAYTLAKGGEKDFGREAIDEILKFMEDHRSDIVIIFAGYNADMERFLEMNEGLKSRIPNTFQFEDYTDDELVQIGLMILHNDNYKVDKEAYAELIKHNFPLSNDHSNGRWVRNLNDKIIRKFALRISKEANADLTLISNDDLNACKL
ncbi:AAA family ATPase [Staphylococcus simulans]|uniref:AAA family ATPase n=1 Tax=Staphylococcus simulans TaxID=1286 RepID=UPI001E4F635D|nr:AAA family ATPase [Staphylococcus simulans]MCD8914294.1 AAA family ATPase [Staphylococcus simulans]